MDIAKYLAEAVQKGASDIFIVSGAALAYKSAGMIFREQGAPLTPEDTRDIVTQICVIAGMDADNLRKLKKEMDFSFPLPDVGRFRVNVYKQRGSLSAVLRFVPFTLPESASLGIPPAVMELAACKNGIVLVTGPAGSGKSTTLACLVRRINNMRSGHIITIEDPIEFLHRHKRCIVSQREINIDTESYLDALRAALRQSPDFIQLGEMRDHEIINVAMTAAEMGRLVLSTLHTLGAVSTIERIIDAFPVNQQQQVRIQLSSVLKAVVSQQLIPSVNGGLVPAFEIMTVNSEIKRMIRDERTDQIEMAMQCTEGMQTMDSCIERLYQNGIITPENAVEYAYNSENMKKRIYMA